MAILGQSLESFRMDQLFPGEAIFGGPRKNKDQEPGPEHSPALKRLLAFTKAFPNPFKDLTEMLPLLEEKAETLLGKTQEDRSKNARELFILTFKVQWFFWWYDLIDEDERLLITPEQLKAYQGLLFAYIKKYGPASMGKSYEDVMIGFMMGGPARVEESRQDKV